MPGTRLKTLIVGIALGAVTLVAGTAWAGGGAVEATHAPAKNGRIVFDRLDTGTANSDDVMIMNASGSGEADIPTIGNNGVDEFDADISPNGKLIVFARLNGLVPDIFIIRANGTGIRNLTDENDGFDGTPTFSPNGRRIAYAAADGPDLDILTMKLDGSGKDNLTESSATSDSDPSYSPNGKQIVYGHFDGGALVHVMNADGTNQHQVSPDGVDASDPRFFPSGKRLIFDLLDGGDYDVASMKLDGSDIQNLTEDNPGSNDFAGAVSPDGKRFAFVSRREGGDTDRDVWVANFSDLDGAVNLTSDGAGPFDDSSPSWEHVYRCGGKRATIVGSAANEKIKGTPKRDVIVGNGGRDRIRGRGGRDRICGGKGRDRLIGGGGRDLLKGGPGRDRTRQ